MLEVEVDFKSRKQLGWETPEKGQHGGLMTIGELAASGNLRASAIRFYEKAGLLPVPARRNGRRVYAAEAANRLFLIAFAKDTGFSLPEIKVLLHGFPQTTSAGDRWRKLATSKISQLEASIRKARAMEGMLRSIMKCRCTTIEQCARGLAACVQKRRASRA
jgi:MerR family transcriptional regulator, redox-sensitive transcriptional activator SoxR